MEQAPETLTVTAADAMEVLKANPLAMEQAKVAALNRIKAANALTIRQQVQVITKLTQALSAGEEKIPGTLEEAETLLAAIKSQNSHTPVVPESTPAG